MPCFNSRGLRFAKWINCKFENEVHQGLKTLVASFMKLMNESNITAKAVSNPDVEILKEIKEIKQAFENSDKVKSGKVKSRPIDQLLNEL